MLVGALLDEMTHLYICVLWTANEVACWLYVAAAVGSTDDINIVESKIRTTTITTEDVVILRVRLRSASDVHHCDIRDNDAVARVAGRPAIEVILLDIDAVDGDVLNVDVFVGDAVTVLMQKCVSWYLC